MSNISWMSDNLRKKAHFFTAHEAAWDISDVGEIIEEATSNKKVILGGDILNTDMEYTCDNWYYSPDRTKDKEYNVRQSCNHTLMYLSDYLSPRGMIIALKNKVAKHISVFLLFHMMTMAYCASTWAVLSF